MSKVASRPGPPIIVCAPIARSGTTYCKFLLNSHPKVYRTLLHEDYLLQNADSLRFYVDSLYDKWGYIRANQSLKAEKSSPDSLLTALGDTILRHIGQRMSSDRILLKTPNLCDLHVANRLFPECQVLVMIRDPRSIVSSYLRVQQDWGVSHSFEAIADRWVKAIRDLSYVLGMNQDAVKSNRLILVRYERLVSNTEFEFRALLEKLSLPMTSECIEVSRNPIVRGSSFMPRNKDGKVDFRPQPMPADFNPIERWSDWTPERHAKFNRICGSLMKTWGYPPL